MSVVQTLLVFAGIPLGVIVILALATLAPAAVRGQIRYRPGRPWEYDTAWWLPGGSDGGAVHGGAEQAAIEAEARSTSEYVEATARDEADRAGASAAEAQQIGERRAAQARTAAVGGASGEW